MIILVDQDGPLADFEKTFLDRWRAQYPHEFFIPVDQRKTFYLRDEYPRHLRNKIEAIHCSPGFYLGLPPTPGCREALHLLLGRGHDVWICTAPLSEYEHCVIEKYQWVENYFGRAFTKRIIMTKDKTLVRGDVLIDDRLHVTGIYKPEWEHILFDSSYNRQMTAKKRLNWGNFTEVLRLKI